MSQTIQIAAVRPPSYEPFGWHQWHDDFWMSYQFRRGLGETQAKRSGLLHDALRAMAGATSEAEVRARRGGLKRFQSLRREDPWAAPGGDVEFRAAAAAAATTATAPVSQATLE